jgi:hypothetical protein
MVRVLRGLTKLDATDPVQTPAPVPSPLSSDHADYNRRLFYSIKADDRVAFLFDKQLVLGTAIFRECRLHAAFNDIPREQLPQGCKDLLYRYEPDWDYRLVQAATICCDRYLFDVFYRGGGEVGACLPGDVKTCATRAISKEFRFPGCAPFRPEPDFIYVGYGYR